MRRLLIALAIIVLPSFALALGHGGGGHGGFAGGHGGFGGWHGGFGGWHGHASIARGPRMAAWSGHMAAWNGHVGNWNHFHHGHFVHRHGRVFFVGGPWWWDGWGSYGYYDDGCWQWVPTPSGLRHVWVCGDYY